jgi:hypothetical protein
MFLDFISRAMVNVPYLPATVNQRPFKASRIYLRNARQLMAGPVPPRHKRLATRHYMVVLPTSVATS